MSAFGNDAPVKVVAASGKALIRRMGWGEGEGWGDRLFYSWAPVPVRGDNLAANPLPSDNEWAVR